MTPALRAVLAAGFGFAAGAAYYGSHVRELADQLEGARHDATHDPLTGLLNRAGFEQQGTALLAAAGESTTVILFDLDQFKPVNDTHGHDVGDVVLVEVAERLADAVGPHGIVARLGGDEFAVVLNSTAEDAIQVLSDAHRLIGFPLDVTDDLVLSVGVTAGVAAARDGESLQALLKAADVALYVAKQTGEDWMVRPVGEQTVQHRPAHRTRDETEPNYVPVYPS